MIRAFVFVTTRSFRNRIVSRFRRLREPRYAIGFAVGLIYLWSVFFRRMFAARHYGLALPATDLAIDIAAVVILALAILPWALPDSGGGLTFSEAEIQFLFPAPVTRRQLLVYKIFREQPQIFISTLMISLFGFRSAHFVAIWISFVTMSIYLSAVRLARARLKVAGIGFLARLAAVVVLVTALVALFAHELRAFDAAAFRPRMGGSFGLDGPSPFHTPVLRALLFVPRIFGGVVLPLSPVQLAVNCAAMIAIGALLLELAARLNVAFEEASLVASQKQTDRRARKSGRAGSQVIFRRIPPPFRIPSKSRPELAILWKNLTASLRISVAWLVFLAIILAALFGRTMLAHDTDLMSGTAMIALLLCGLFPYIGSSIFNHDLRLDLARIEILKSYPLSGERLVAAEIAAPLMIISLIEILLLLATVLLLQLAGISGTLTFFATPQFVVVALLFAVPICAMQLLLRNAMAILFPAWAVRSAEESRGFAVMGQRLVVMGGMLLMVVLTLLPAAVLFFPALFLSRSWFGDSPGVLAVATMPAVAVLVAEAWLMLRFLGGQFERIDVTTEIGTALV